MTPPCGQTPLALGKVLKNIRKLGQHTYNHFWGTTQGRGPLLDTEKHSFYANARAEYPLLSPTHKEG